LLISYSLKKAAAMKYVIAVALLLSMPLIAFGQVRCDTDCNARCPTRWVKAGPFKTKYRDPTCKAFCEAEKPPSCIIGVPIPAPRGILEEAQKRLEQSCAAGFEVVTKAVILSCPPMVTQQEANLFEGLKRDLVSAGVVGANAFQNVSFKFCRLNGADGMAPDRNVVYIHDGLRSAPTYELAVTLAHEMKHIEQYRQLGTDAFKCNYTKQFIKCDRCQDRKHELEREAYEFEDRARYALAGFYGQQVQPYSNEGIASLFGSFGVVDGRCQPRVGPARIYQRADGVLIASNECRTETELEDIGDDRILAKQWGGLVGDVRGHAIYWRNNTQWYRNEGSPPLVGSWDVDRGGCSPRVGPARVFVNANGALMAANECGSETQLQVQGDGSVLATMWNGLGGDVAAGGSHIAWRNGTNWRWLRP